MQRKTLTKTALILSEEPTVYETALRMRGFNVETSKKEESPYDLIVCDLRSIELSQFLSLVTQTPKTLFICLVPDRLLPEVLEYSKQHTIFGYLPLPFALETLENLFDKTVQHLEGSSSKTRKVIAESLPMKKLLEDVAYIAKSHSSVFIRGESGTGKEMIAQMIHSHSPRSASPFIKVNCAAIPATLLESEFFGHEKGAFTGAIQRKLGRFELAHLGTLLLDEISEISLELQPKLLRAIQEMEFERVGGTKPITVNVRLVSTSNRSMEELLDQKLFREDLFYRLNVVPIHLPPLREHAEDIIPLAEYFLTTLSTQHGLPLKTFSPSAKEFLKSYTWPGNIRELANVIERALVMHTFPVIEKEHFRLDDKTNAPSPPVFGRNNPRRNGKTDDPRKA